MSLSGLLTDKTGGNSQQVMARSHVFTVARQKRTISQRKKEAMVTFIKWMGENSAEWSGAGQIPAFNAARETDEFKNAPYVNDSAIRPYSVPQLPRRISNRGTKPCSST